MAISNLEALGILSRPAVSYYASLATLSKAAVTQLEALTRQAAPAISNFAAAGLVSQTELSAIESSARIARAATEVFEVLAGQVARTAAPTFEALTRAAGQAIARLEALGIYIAVSQTALSSFEALHPVARNSGLLNYEAYRLAYGLILTQILFAQLSTTEQGFAASVEVEKEFASTLELVARFLIHEP